MSEATENRIKSVCNGLSDFLISKNRKYGDSAINPTRVFANNSVKTALLVRADDKISRIQNSNILDRDDMIDLMGYCVLICIAHGWVEFDTESEKLQ